ncbi:23110_t:CDS:1, partial [Racocetra persica]
MSVQQQLPQIQEQNSQIQSRQQTLEGQQQDLQILFSKALEPIIPQPNH